MQKTHDQEFVGLNPGTVYMMDVSDASYYIHKNNKNKGSRMGHTNKKYLKKYYGIVNSNLFRNENRGPFKYYVKLFLHF